MRSKLQTYFIHNLDISLPIYLINRLKRRLEQYEHDRQIERAQANRLQAKREADIEARLRKDRVCTHTKSSRVVNYENDLDYFRIEMLVLIKMCAS